jgi:hypothetical protein
VVGADVVVVVVVVVVPDDDPPELELRGLDDVDLRALVLGLEYVAPGAGATTAGVVVAALRSAAEIESSVA